MEPTLKQLNDSTLNWIICHLDFKYQHIESNNLLSKTKSEKINSILETMVNEDMEDKLPDIINVASGNSLSESFKKKIPDNIIGLIYFYREIEQKYEEENLELAIYNNGTCYSSMIKMLEVQNYKSKIPEIYIKRIANFWDEDKKHISKLNFLNNTNSDLITHIENYMADNTDYYDELKDIGLFISEDLSIESIKAYWLYYSDSWQNESILYQLEKFKRSVSNKRYRLEKKEQKKKSVSYMFSEDAINALNKLTEGSMLEKGAYLERLILREYTKFISEPKY